MGPGRVILGHTAGSQVKASASTHWQKNAIIQKQARLCKVKFKCTGLFNIMKLMTLRPESKKLTVILLEALVAFAARVNTCFTY